MKFCKKIVSIVGARPQFIKLAPLSKKLRSEHQEVIVHTGQHFDDNMSLSLFNDLQIPTPDYYLNINTGSHGQQTGRMLNQIEQVLLHESPELVIVFGDTNSTLAGALAAVKLHIPVLHIESGLRSNNRQMPEEINRLAVDHISDYLFVPTKNALNILKNEGLTEHSYLTGDIMVDVLSEHIAIARQRSGLLKNLNVTPNGYYLLTLHRPYNVDSPKQLAGILHKLSDLDKPVVFPAHPRTKQVIVNNNISLSENIIITDPLGYLDFLNMQFYSIKIITDSGGIQKEAYLLQKPCLTLRSETEWIETVQEGWNVLIQPTQDDFVETIKKFRPTEEQRGFLGSDVAAKMVNIINTL